MKYLFPRFCVLAVPDKGVNPSDTIAEISVVSTVC
jgi:hypothetical protein